MNATASLGAITSTTANAPPAPGLLDRTLDPAGVPVKGGALLIASVLWVLLGTAAFFALYAISARDLSPTGTFISALAAGGIGSAVASLSLRKLPGYRWFLACMAAAYLLRVLVGVALYQQVLDPDYFYGTGKYVDSNWEFRWTYQNVMTAADHVLKSGEWRASKVLDDRVDKNLHIHEWMGYFMAAGESRNALDLTPFNAFHHMVAAILVVAMALACGYPPRVAWFSGALVAWIPWAFPGSLMWRDSVGFAAVVLAVAFLCIGREFGIVTSMFCLVPASLLAWADRRAYFAAIVVLAGLSLLFDQQRKVSAGYLKVPRLALVLVLIAGVAYYFSHHIGEIAFAGHQAQASGGYLASRIVLVPLLVLRGLAGPFPWFVGSRFTPYVVFDYLFHLLQFALFLIYVANFRSIVARANILTYAAALFWVIGFISGGVHTAYLAVAFPFVVAPVLATGSKFWKYLAFSAVCFVLANMFYVAAGLTGSGMVMGTTGY